MTLHGPHQVAKASRTTTALSLRAESNSDLLHRQERLAYDHIRIRWGTTDFPRLWTPMLTAVLLNALLVVRKKFCVAVRECDGADLKVCAVMSLEEDDRRKSDIRGGGG
jgi:hypothetical protein